MTYQKHEIRHFISEPIQVNFTSPAAHLKKPHCPDRFTWRDEEWIITTCLSEWSDFSRRGRMARNIQPQHAQVASERGSWGVGRFFFDVRTHNGSCFRLYYNRAPCGAGDRAGEWVLLAELSNFEA